MASSAWGRLPVVFVLCCGRSGSSQLMQLFRSLRGMEVFPELFHRGGPDSGLPVLFRAAGLPLGGKKNARLGEWVHADPSRVLDLLVGAAPPGTVALATKLFPGFLEPDFIDHHLMTVPTAGFLLLKRRPIDTYISLQKALAIGRWSQADTTSVRPALRVDDYLSWHKDLSAWYRGMSAMLDRHGRPRLILHYETDIHADEDVTLRRLLELLDVLGISTQVRPRDEVVPAGVSGSGWNLRLWRFLNRRRLAGAASGRRGYPKQDRAESPEQRVSNWDEFVKDLLRDHHPDVLETYF